MSTQTDTQGEGAMTKTVYVILVRHEPHQNNVVAEKHLEHARASGKAFDAVLEKRDIVEPDLMITSPQPRAGQTAKAFCEGAGYDTNEMSNEIDYQIGDLSNGHFAFTADEKGIAQAYATQHGITLEAALLQCPEVAKKMTARGDEAAQACREHVLDVVNLSNEPEPTLLMVGHGARWEPMISRLQGKPINPPDFLMETGSVALLTMAVTGEEVTLIKAEYFGDVTKPVDEAAT